MLTKSNATVTVVTATDGAMCADMHENHLVAVLAMLNSGRIGDDYYASEAHLAAVDQVALEAKKVSQNIRDQMVSDILTAEKVTKTPPLRPFPDYGDKMTVVEMRDCVTTGAFNDCDGSGCYATEDGVSREVFSPSGFDPPTWATHVVWYNK